MKHYTYSPEGELISVEDVPEIISEPATPDTQTDLMALAVDHEYRLTLLELGV